MSDGFIFNGCSGRPGSRGPKPPASICGTCGNHADSV